MDQTKTTVRDDSLSSEKDKDKMAAAHIEHEQPKDLGAGHSDYHGINTSDVLPGADAAYGGANVGGFVWAGEALCACFGSALGGGIDGFLDLAARKGDV